MLEIRNIHKQYEGKPLLRGVSFAVQQGETLALLGASGSGKSTLLRMIAGLEDVEGGDILWDGASILSMPVHHRRFGLMFQDYALFPHRDVWNNVAFGLQMQKTPVEKVQEIVSRSLEKVQMESFAHRSVTDLSGGEQQRVALARTLAADPRLLLLDEPLAALDRSLRQQLLSELRKILRETDIPVIYVTHDQEEAYTIADRLALLIDGRISQIGAPDEVYRHPAGLEVASFLGLTNRIAGRVASVGSTIVVNTPQGEFQVPPSQVRGVIQPGDDVTLVIREARIAENGNPSGTNRIKVRVTDSLFRSTGYATNVRTTDGKEYQFILEQSRSAGDQVQLEIPADQINLFPG